jgi:hypothetical protein
MSDVSLPDQFKELEPFAREWALASEGERNRKRLSSRIDDIQAFYNGMLPRMNEIMSYLNQFPLTQMPEEARRLFHLTLSLAEGAAAVKFYGQPSVVDGFDATRFVPIETDKTT